ncbi:hypothetical protein [Promicromonospora soli]
MTQRTALRWFSGQREDFLALVVAGSLAILAGLATVVSELVRVLPNTHVPVPVDLVDVPNELLLRGGVGAEATEAVIRVSGLGPASFAVVLVAALLPAIMLTGVAVCFTLLGSSFYRGDFFGRRSLVAINTAAATLGLGSVVVPTLQEMAGISALASLDVVSGQTVVMGFDVTMFLAGLLLSVVGYALQRGARLQRDTEGLI